MELEDISKMKEKQDIDGLINAIDECYANYDKIAEIAKALGETGDSRAVNPLIDLMLKPVSPDIFYHPWQSKHCAAQALGKIGDPKAVDALIETLSYDEPHGGRNGFIVRMCAAEALGLIGDVKAIEPLKNALYDKEDQVKKKAEEALRILQEK
jgi:HEAT repeat protein